MTLQQLSFGGVKRISYCSKCKKPLSNPVSVQAGMGPICRGHGGKDMNNDDCNRNEFSDGDIVGEHDGVLLEDYLVLQRIYDTKVHVRTNVPHLVVSHSPNGFEFGYAGSGPADLALNVCQWYLNGLGYRGKKRQCYDGKCWSLAWILHQDFKRTFIETAHRDGAVIPFSQIKNWFDEHITEDLKRTYEIVIEAPWEED